MHDADVSLQATAGTAPFVGPAVQRTAHPLVARRLTVQRVTDLSAHMRRVVLGGPDLAGFASDGPTDHAKVFFPADPDDAASATPALPVVEDGRWVNRDDPHLVCRDYTVRTFRPGSGEVTLDMVVHEHGPAGRWAAQARPGQVLGLLGPKSSKVPPLDRDWYVLAVDQTGLPALTNWLERIAAGARVQAFIEVGGPEDEQELPARERAEVTWLHRGDRAPGTTTLLPDAVAVAPFGDVTDGSGWVWAAAEASVLRAIRTHVSTERGVDRTSFAMTGYWRRGVANFDHKSPDA